MKRVALMLVIVAFALVGCGKETNINNNENYEKKFQVAGEIYYNYFMKSIGMNENIITLEMIEKAIEISEVEFNLKGLESCEKASAVTVIADQSREIVDYAFDLKC